MQLFQLPEEGIVIMGQFVMRLRSQFQSFHTGCWRSFDTSYHNFLQVLDISLPAPCWPEDKFGKWASWDELQVVCCLSTWCLWDRNSEVFACVAVVFRFSALFSFAPHPITFSIIYFSVACPLPHHKNVRCYFDFCFHGPLVANVRYSLRSDDECWHGLFLPYTDAVTESIRKG